MKVKDLRQSDYNHRALENGESREKSTSPQMPHPSGQNCGFRFELLRSEGKCQKRYFRKKSLSALRIPVRPSPDFYKKGRAISAPTSLFQN